MASCFSLLAVFATTLLGLIPYGGSDQRNMIPLDRSEAQVFRGAGVPPVFLRCVEGEKSLAGRRRHNAFGCASPTLGLVAAREGNDQDQRGRIRTEVTLVSMLASVLDKDGRPMLGLTADQFEVSEEGVNKRLKFSNRKLSSPWTWH